jgi:membrane protein DedA with SNARE-associated domain
LTYRIGAKGGEETLEKKIGKQRAQKVYRKFEKAGFTTLVVSVLIPPPFPIVPVLLAAGVLKYPTKKFLIAIAAGRATRFVIDAMLGIYFGRAIIGFFSQYYKPALYTLLGLAVVGGIGGLIYYKRWKSKKQGVGRQQERAA